MQCRRDKPLTRRAAARGAVADADGGGVVPADPVPGGGRLRLRRGYPEEQHRHGRMPLRRTQVPPLGLLSRRKGRGLSGQPALGGMGLEADAASCRSACLGWMAGPCPGPCGALWGRRAAIMPVAQ